MYDALMDGVLLNYNDKLLWGWKVESVPVASTSALVAASSASAENCTIQRVESQGSRIPFGVIAFFTSLSPKIQPNPTMANATHQPSDHCIKAIVNET